MNPKRKASKALVVATAAAVAKRQAKKKKIFLRELAKIPSVSRSASLAGTNRTAVYLWRREDNDFKEAWEQALAASIDRVEAEALAFALKRPPEGSSSMSAWVNLVQFVLRSHKRSVYGDKLEAAVMAGVIYLPQKVEGPE